jgi:hypothetical protein
MESVKTIIRIDYLWWKEGEGTRLVEFQFAFAPQEYSSATSEFQSVGV